MLYVISTLALSLVLGAICFKVFTEDRPQVMLVFTMIAMTAMFSGGLLGTRQTVFSEYRGYYATAAEYQEVWTTHETRLVSHTKTDSKGVTHTTYTTEHYTETHGPFYSFTLNTGETRSVGSGEYAQAKVLWSNEQKVGEHEGSAAGWRGSVFQMGEKPITGGIFKTTWPHTNATIVPILDKYTYVNKLRACHQSVFKFSTATPELKKKYPRPVDTKDDGPIYNIDAPIKVLAEDQLVLQQVNAEQGVAHEVHTMVFLFDASKHTPAVTNDVLSAWEGVNKNELVIFMGIEPQSTMVSWVKVESWCDNTRIHKEIETALLFSSFYGQTIAKCLRTNVPLYWHRKHFKDFNYLRVPVEWYGYLIYGIMMAIGGAVLIWYRKQQQELENCS
jgi:hypothetical protein